MESDRVAFLEGSGEKLSRTPPDISFRPPRAAGRCGEQLDLVARFCAWAAPIDPNRTSRAIVNSVWFFLISIKLLFIVLIFP